MKMAGLKKVKKGQSKLPPEFSAFFFFLGRGRVWEPDYTHSADCSGHGPVRVVQQEACIADEIYFVSPFVRP